METVKSLKHWSSVKWGQDERLRTAADLGSESLLNQSGSIGVTHYEDHCKILEIASIGSQKTRHGKGRRPGLYQASDDTARQRIWLRTEYGNTGMTWKLTWQLAETAKHVHES